MQTYLDERVSAVFRLTITADLILAVRNERGWDIPGGHVEADESRHLRIARETLEEPGQASPGPCRSQPSACLNGWT
jgi:ADP-ribose pyrophosphatase YjhB (NUDIX family)